MKKKLTLRNGTIALVAFIILSQFIRIDKTHPPVNYDLDFLTMTKPSAEVASVIKTACYDCHSDEVVYPWYTNIAPVSWWIKHHVNEGTHHLNFSIWGSYKSRKADHKLEECVEMLEEKEMPMSSYTWMHEKAKLSDEQRNMLIKWINSIRTHESDKKEASNVAADTQRK